jgi:hypothetical protein
MSQSGVPLKGPGNNSYLIGKENPYRSATFSERHSKGNTDVCTFVHVPVHGEGFFADSMLVCALLRYTTAGSACHRVHPVIACNPEAVQPIKRCLHVQLVNHRKLSMM